MKEVNRFFVSSSGKIVLPSIPSEDCRGFIICHKLKEVEFSEKNCFLLAFVHTKNLDGTKIGILICHYGTIFFSFLYVLFVGCLFAVGGAYDVYI